MANKDCNAQILPGGDHVRRSPAATDAERVATRGELRVQTLSEFVLDWTYDRAVAMNSEENVPRLSQRDAETFARAIAEPAKIDDTVLTRFRKSHQQSQR